MFSYRSSIFKIKLSIYKDDTALKLALQCKCIVIAINLKIM